MRCSIQLTRIQVKISYRQPLLSFYLSFLALGDDSGDDSEDDGERPYGDEGEGEEAYDAADQTSQVSDSFLLECCWPHIHLVQREGTISRPRSRALCQ